MTWGETVTGTFADVQIGDVFKRPWVFQMYRKVDDKHAVGLTNGAEYRFYPHSEIRQDVYTEMAQNRV